MKGPTLTTERLIMRPWEPGDAEGMAAFYADPSSRFVGGPFGPERAWRQVAYYAGHRALRGYGPFALEERATGRFVGYCGPYFPLEWPEPEIAYGLLPGARGRGLAVEAVLRALRHAYDELGWTTAISAADVANHASRRVSERAGATLESRRRLMDFDAVIYRHRSPSGLAA